MAEGLATEDGTAIDLDAAEQEFAMAMLAPEPGEPEHPAPPKREQLSEEELGAKYGWTTDAQGNRRAKRAKGRPRAARVTEAPPVAEKPAGPAKGKGDTQPRPDFTRPLTELTAAMWMVAAAVPVPGDALRTRIRAQAKVLRSNQPGLVSGLNLMAQNNGTIRRGVEALTMGAAGWVLPATMAVAPFCVQSAQLWRTDPAELTALAAQTEQEWAEEFEAMQRNMGLDDATAAEFQAEKEFIGQETA